MKTSLKIAVIKGILFVTTKTASFLFFALPFIGASLFIAKQTYMNDNIYDIMTVMLIACPLAFWVVDHFLYTDEKKAKNEKLRNELKSEIRELKDNRKSPK